MITSFPISRLLTGSINLLFYLPKFIQRGLGWTIFYWGIFSGVRRTCPGTHIPIYTDVHDFFTSSPVSSFYIMSCWQYIHLIFLLTSYFSLQPPLSLSLSPLILSLYLPPLSLSLYLSLSLFLRLSLPFSNVKILLISQPLKTNINGAKVYEYLVQL